MSEYSKPLPVMPDYEMPYWEAAKDHELKLQKCSDCGNLIFPINPRCPNCLSANHEWVNLSGKGRVSSWIIYHQPFHPGFAGDIPYNVAWVELEEGPRVTTNIVETKNEDIYIGMPVEAVFDDVTDEVTLVKFRPNSQSS